MAGLESDSLAGKSGVLLAVRAFRFWLTNFYGVFLIGGQRPCCGSVLCCAVTGMRISEALKLDPTDINLESGELAIHRSKNGQVRSLPVHPSVIERLSFYAAERRRLVYSWTRSGNPPRKPQRS